MKREREREKTEKERKKAFNVWTDVTPAWDDHTHTRMLPLGCSRLTDSNLPGLKSTGFTDSRLNWDQPFARITTCVMSRLISVQAKRGCENEEQVAAPPLCRSCI